MKIDYPCGCILDVSPLPMGASWYDVQLCPNHQREAETFRNAPPPAPAPPPPLMVIIHDNITAKDKVV